jgi:hypothetical protein
VVGVRRGCGGRGYVRRFEKSNLILLMNIGGSLLAVSLRLLMWNNVASDAGSDEDEVAGCWNALEALCVVHSQHCIEDSSHER